METLEAHQLAYGARVRVHNKSHLDHAFEGQCGTFIEMTKPHGFMRLHLDIDPSTARVLVHPESVELLETSPAASEPSANR